MQWLLLDAVTGIVINHEPDYLLVLYLNKNGNIYEVYNGTGRLPWNTASTTKNK